MKWVGTLIAAWSDIRSQPLRACAVILGLATAIAAVVVADASNRISEDANAAYVERAFGKEATFLIRPTDNASTLPDSWRRSASAAFEARAVNGNTPQLSRYSSVTLSIPSGTDSVNLDARWVSPSYPAVATLELQSGTWPRNTVEGYAVRVVLTQAGLATLGLSQDEAIGKVIPYFGEAGSQFDLRFRPRYPMVIEGVVASSGRSQEGVEALIITESDQIPGLDAYPTNWLVYASPADQPMVEHLAQSFLGGPDPTVMFDVRRMDQQGEIKPVLDQQRTTSNVLSVIILGVAAIGMLSTGLSGIRERAQEFGIRRAIGVTTKSIFAGVVMQTVIEALFAAAIALTLSAILVAVAGERMVLVDVELTSTPALPWASALRGFVSALIVGIVASLMPAFRAARYSVTDVIRA